MIDQLKQLDNLYIGQIKLIRSSLSDQARGAVEFTSYLGWGGLVDGCVSLTLRLTQPSYAGFGAELSNDYLEQPPDTYMIPRSLATGKTLPYFLASPWWILCKRLMLCLLPLHPPALPWIGLLANMVKHWQVLLVTTFWLSPCKQGNHWGYLFTHKTCVLWACGCSAHYRNK